MQNTRRKETEGIEDGDNQQPPNSFPPSQEAADHSGLSALQLENFELRSRSWQFHNWGTLPVGIALSGTGGTVLLFSYLLTSSILTFIGLGLTFWGVLIIYISSSRHVHSDVLNAITSSMQKTVDDVITYMGYNGEVIFFHPKNLIGLGQGHIFISHYAAKGDGTNTSKLEALNLLPHDSEAGTPSIYLHPMGMFLIAPSQGLVDLFEKELRVNLATVDFSFVQQALPKLLIENLGVVDEVSLEPMEDGNSFVMSFSGGACTEMCTYFDRNSRLGKSLGCPLCSSVALLISKVTGKPVKIKETTIQDDNKKNSTTFLVIGP
jgi:hypothetical protein